MTLPPFLIPILVGLIAQFLKGFFNQRWLADTKIRGVSMPRYGGMPSAHTAFVFSLVTVVGTIDGIVSATFAIASAMAIFILDDALRMRIFIGRQGQAILRLIKQLPAHQRTGFPELEPRLGHNARETVAGAAIGVTLTLLILLLTK